MTKENKQGEQQNISQKFNWSHFQRNKFTYKWQFYSEKHKQHYEYSEDMLYQKGAIMEGEERTECTEVELYTSPEKPPYDFYIKYGNWQLALRVEFFKEVFEERAFIEGHQPQHKYVKLVIPSTIHYKILNVINDFKLLHIRDLLMEVIATAQDTYIKDVAFWERPENQKLITSAKKETAKAIQVIEQSSVDIKSWLEFKGKIRPQLDHIKFVFNTGTIKLEHEWLAHEFIENMKRSYDDMHYKDWKKDLARYPNRFQENAYKSQFKYHLAKSYYNLFTKAKFFDVTEEKPFTNRLMLCIAKLIEFALIPVGDWDETEDIKVKHIRNWLKRNDLEPSLTYAEIPADLERLKKYFEPNFIEMADANKRADAISVAFFICQRFDIQDLMADLIHIASCIKETNWLVGHQMTSNNKMNEPDIPEMNAFRQLMNGVKEKKKLTSIKFTIEGNETEQELTQRLPLYLIEEALKEYYHSYQVEFNTDAIPTKFNKEKDGSIKVSKESHFSLPHERHLVQLVHSMYKFLKDNSGIEEVDILSGEPYYEIIAILFQQTWVFYNQIHDEKSIVNKIKQWHRLTSES